jgi:hypothetical protein
MNASSPVAALPPGWLRLHAKFTGLCASDSNGPKVS